MRIEETLKKIGINVKKARLKMGLTQEELGEKSGLDSRHIGFIERGEINSTVKTLSKIAHGLGCPVGSLLRKI
jgi:transcriptional regulator with XRE-family HTH domain